MFKRYTNLIFPFLMAMLALALIVSQSTTTAYAATITVNSSADLVADDGQCTLREAITAANSDSASGAMAGECPAGSGDDTIILSAESYTLTIAGAEENSNATGDLDLMSNISIEVASGSATLDGNQLDRVLHLHDGAIVSLSDVTITGGKTADGIDGAEGEPGGDADHGGGIYNAGTLTLTDSSMINNATGNGGEGGDRAEGDWGDGGDGGDAGDGGGIYNASFAQLTIINSHISNNLTGEGGNGGDGYGYSYGGNGGKAGDGAAIYNATSASLTIRQSTLNANMTGQGGRGASDDLFFPAAFGGDGGRGGHGSGIFNAGELTFSQNTIEGNGTGAGGKGGDCFYKGIPGKGAPGGFGSGIYNVGLLTLAESSIRYNTTGNGGAGGNGVYNFMIEFESCPDGDGGQGGNGSGIYNGSAGEMSISSSIISHNSTGYGGDAGNQIGLGNGGMGGAGGGIYNASTLTLLASTISDNTTGNGGNGASSDFYDAGNGGDGGQGGAIYNAESADLIMSDSTIMHNMTGDGGMGGSVIGDDFFFNPSFGGNGGDGSGIFNHGIASLSNSTVSNNRTGNGGNGEEGGRGGNGAGIAHKGNGSLILLTSTVSGNRTGNGGNGAHEQDGGRGGNGGGLFTTSTLTISHSTIANNSTGSGGEGGVGGSDGSNGDGGGIVNEEEGDTTLKNSILANNSSGNGPDCIGILSSEGYNLIQDASDCELIGDMTGNLTDMTAYLAPLSDNGGSTLTHALPAGSAALDAGSCSEQATDQRHYPRPFDVPLLPNALDGCDMGAYETELRDAYLIKSVDDSSPSAGQRISYTITVGNIGTTPMTQAIVSDTLPTGLTLAAPVTLSPPQAGAILAQNAADLPTLASNLIITPTTSITLTVPVTVNIGVVPGTSLTNIAVVTSSEVPTPTQGAVTIRLPAPDINLEQTLNRNDPFNHGLPGEPITYSLAFSNIGDALATGVVLTDIVPAILTSVAITQTGAAITDRVASPPYVWEVADLAAGAGGIITITGVISPELSNNLMISNTAIITAINDIEMSNNQEQINLSVEVPQVYFNNSSVTVPEGDSTKNISVRLNRRTPYRTVSVDYTAPDGTASAGEDYGIMGDSTPLSGTLTFENDSSIMLTIPILDDKLTEGDETILLSLSNPRGATLGTQNSAIITILDNEASPTPTFTATPTNTSTPTITLTPTITPTSTPTITTQGVMDKLYLPLLLKN